MDMKYSNIKNYSLALLLALTLGLVGCQTTVPKDALTLSPQSLETRQIQTRKYEGIKENDILAASAGVIQDLGFNIDESETALGVLVASKERDATEAGQVVLAVFVAVLTGAAMAIDKNQKLRVSLVVRPVNDRTELDHYVRVTFQRMIWNTEGQISKIEGINEPEIYQEFFSQLSKSVFLEGQKI